MVHENGKTLHCPGRDPSYSTAIKCLVNMECMSPIPLAWATPSSSFDEPYKPLRTQLARNRENTDRHIPDDGQS